MLGKALQRLACSRLAPAPAPSPAPSPAPTPAPSPTPTTAPAPAPAPALEKQPLAAAILTKAKSPAIITKFLGDSLAITERNGREAAHVSEYMRKGALQRYLKRVGCTTAYLYTQEDNLDAEGLLDLLFEIDSEAVAPKSLDTAPAAESAVAGVTKVFIDAGVNVSGTPEEQCRRATFIRHRGRPLTSTPSRRRSSPSTPPSLSPRTRELQERFDKESDSTLISLANIDVEQSPRFSTVRLTPPSLPASSPSARGWNAASPPASSPTRSTTMI